MGLLDRFSNPIRHKVSKLDKDRQYIIAVIISGYDFLCNAAREELISPLEPFLKQDHSVTMPDSNKVAPEVTRRLVEEVLVGLLRCCSVPCADPSGRPSSALIEGLPEVWGTFVLADINHRLSRSSPNVLEETDYWSDPDEARTQVHVKWMGILGTTNPSLVSEVNRNGFASVWSEFAESFLAGVLKGSSRTPDEVLLSRARRAAADIPLYRAVLVEYIIDRSAYSVDRLLPRDQYWEPLSGERKTPI